MTKPVTLPAGWIELPTQLPIAIDAADLWQIEFVQGVKWDEERSRPILEPCRRSLDSWLWQLRGVHQPPPTRPVSGASAPGVRFHFRSGRMINIHCTNTREALATRDALLAQVAQARARAAFVGAQVNA